MNEEVEMKYALWQKMVQAQMLWAEEISQRLSVDIPLELDGVMLQFIGLIEGKGHAEADQEMRQVLDNVELVYHNICSIHGDPNRRDIKYRESSDLWGREPLQAIAEEALHYIDVALVGPLDQAARLLATDQRLYAAAKAREKYADPSAGWQSRVQDVIARADAILARRALDGALNGI